VFGFLGSDIVKIMEDASDWMDSVKAGNQAPSKAFMHSMRDGTRNQSVLEAERAANKYINDELRTAARIQLEYEADGGEGLSGIAAMFLSHAVHTAMDATSPEHRGYQPWCLLCLTPIEHKYLEDNSAISADTLEDEARHEAYVAAQSTLMQFLRMEEELKKKQHAPDPDPDIQPDPAPPPQPPPDQPAEDAMCGTPPGCDR
jgi:hypothetical protein